MTDSWPISWWVLTGRYTEFEGGISSPIYRCPETGEEKSSRELPIGACYEREPFTYQDGWKTVGADGKCVVCKLPDGHHWIIDMRCNNCTRPEDVVHRCWVRHGTVGDKNLHVDKAGDTCTAGAGSIQTSKWHGFLHNGVVSVRG